MTRQLSKWKIKQLALVGVVCAISLIAGAGTALADAGPHRVGAGPVADGCAGCHRAHTAKAPSLLKEAQPGLCYTCHGLGGAQTNVIDGSGSGGAALRGGGFEYALIDSDNPTYNGDGTPPNKGIAVPANVAGEAVTSTHSVDLTSAKAWGNGPTSSTASYGKTVQLRCGSCHDPHGNGNYRILKPIPAESGATPAITIADPTVKTYTTANYWSVQDVNDTDTVMVAGKYGPEAQLTGPFIGNISAWCSTCHTRYLSKSGKDNSGDAVYTYRHTSDKISAKIDGTGNRSCVQCHVSHGSNATMGSRSNSVTNPDGTSAGAVSSKLLRINNRGVCQMCHNK